MAPRHSIEILVQVIDQADWATLVTCLRVSKAFFKAAGKHLYSYIDIDEETDVDGLFLGSDIVNKRASDASSNSANASAKKTNYKRQLLQMIKTVVVRIHYCPEGRTARAARSKAARLANHVERVIIVPPHDYMLTSALCDHEGDGSRECPIVKGFNKCKSATIHNIEVDGPEDGPLELFPSLLKHLDRVTLVIPPTAFYIHKRYPISGRPEDLAYATKHIESIRVIVAIKEWDIMSHDYGLQGSGQLCQLPPLISFLAEMILLQKAKFDIFVFHDFDGKLDIDQFELHLSAEIEKEKTKAIEWQKSEGKPTDETEAWEPKLGAVGDIIDYYFAKPRLSDELDEMWSSEFEVDLLKAVRKWKKQVKQEEEAAGIDE